MVIILRIQERNKSLGMPENMQFGLENVTLSPIAYITADFKKVVSDLFHPGCTLLESECIKRKMKLSEQPRNITIALKSFHMQYRSTFAMHQSDFTLQIPK